MRSWSEAQALSNGDFCHEFVSSGCGSSGLFYIEQYSPEDINRIFEVASYIKANYENRIIKKLLGEILFSRACTLYFTQGSTRTINSFSLAAQTLGMKCQEIRDPELSAMFKGESELDTLLTMAALSDLLVIRRPQTDELPRRLAYELKRRDLSTKVINAGSGMDEHPTQALLELFTVFDHHGFGFSQLKGSATVAIVGDLKRSRTARSLAMLLSMFPNIRLCMVAPDELQMAGTVTDFVQKKGASVSFHQNLDEVLPIADVVYMQRIQDEYDVTSEEVKARYSDFHLSTNRVACMRTNAIIIHPLPRRQELPIEVDYDHRARYWHAVLNGKMVRTALIMDMFGNGLDDIRIK